MDNSTSISRRGLIAAGAAVTAGAIACSQAVGTPALADEASWDGEYDVIVCGAGMAGCCAAITAITEDDAATVLLLEKGDGPRGNSAYAAGYTIYAEDADKAYTGLKSLDGRANTPDDVLRAFAEGLVENGTWFNDLGAKEDWIIREKPGTSVEDALEDLPYDFPELSGYDALGFIHFKTTDSDGPANTMTFLQTVMDEKKSDRLTYLTETPMERLIQDEQTGEVTGIVAGGKRYRARGGVILCTGGYEMNDEMRFNYTGVREAYPSVSTLNTGDGIREAMRVGADLWRMRGGQLYWTSPRNLDNDRFMSVIWDASTKQNGITVGVNGRRFFMDYDGEMTCLDHASPDGDLSTTVGWRHSMTNFGGHWVIALPMPERSWFVFDQAGLDAGAIPPEVSSDPVADGWAYSSDTIEGLAEQMGVPADELKRTCDAWNKSCDAGFDEAFYRPEDTLTPVRTAPFYAMLCVPQFDNTNGGPRRGAGAEVLDVDGNPIPHLYEAGELGSVWGEYFQGAGDYADCAAFGRIAARNALKNLQA
ncbi:MAG: FAD-dependent oxidoreductase [Coriobacteriales bacterium]|jgi:succinate dehydrogenase/fumarate reductase flavoprotein subunit